MTVHAECREAANRGEALRIDDFLMRRSIDGTVSIEQFARLIAERSRRLADHILNGVQVNAHERRVELPAESLRELESDLQRLGVPPGKPELCALAARHVESALTRTLSNPSLTSMRDPFATQQGDIVATEIVTKLASGDPTVDPGQLDTWLEFRQGVARLEPKLRQIVDLLFFVGLPAEGAARVLAVPVETVLERWRAAKIRLALAGANLIPE